MPYCDMGGKKQELFALHQEERRLMDALSVVRTKLNALVHVSTLPDEILEYIFEVCVSWLYEYRKPRHRLAWTHVCRRWRLISLNASRLWRNIDLCDSHLAHEFLIRSGSAPIRLQSTNPTKLSLADLKPHANRIASINVHLFPEDMIELFEECGLGISGIVNLSLKVPPMSTSFVLDLKSSLPCLRKLMLDCVSIPWNLCRGLTHLNLRGLTAGFSPSISELLTIFDASPDLELIRLTCVSPTMSECATRPQRPIHLIHLRELGLHAKAPVIQSILSNLFIPSAARLHINCSQPYTLHCLLPLGHSRVYTNPNIHAIHLERDGFQLSSSTTPWNRETVEAIVSFTSSCPISKHLLPDIFNFFDLTRITVLEIGPGVLFDLTEDPISSFLTHIHSLEALRIAFTAHHYLSPLLQILSVPVEPLNCPPYFPCPCLRKISFGRVGDGTWWHFAEDWLSSLVALAKARYDAAIPLEVLEFPKCQDMSPELCAKLKDIVGHVYADVDA